MEERVEYEMNWNTKVISLKKLEKGHIYVTREILGKIENNRVRESDIMMYLGLLKNGKHAFYHFCKATLAAVNDYDCRTFANYDAQVGGIRQIIDVSMKTRAYAECIITCSKNPGIIGEFPFQDYADVYLDWYNKSFTEDDDVPKISEGKIKTDYVRTSELVLGGLYYTNPTGNIFMYLGRRSDGRFVWYPVYDRNNLEKALKDVEDMYDTADVTTSNKRCKPIACGAEDKDISRSWKKHTIRDLANDPPKLDVFGIDQAMMDTAKTWGME